MFFREEMVLFHLSLQEQSCAFVCSLAANTVVWKAEV